MFWIGLIIGLFIGANVGLVVFTLFASKKGNDDCYSYYSKFFEAASCCI